MSQDQAGAYDASPTPGNASREAGYDAVRNPQAAECQAPQPPISPSHVGGFKRFLCRWWGHRSESLAGWGRNGWLCTRCGRRHGEQLDGSHYLWGHAQSQPTTPGERCTADASLHLGTYRCDRHAGHDGPHCIDGNAGFPLHTWGGSR